MAPVSETPNHQPTNNFRKLLDTNTKQSPRAPADTRRRHSPGHVAGAPTITNDVLMVLLVAIALMLVGIFVYVIYALQLATQSRAYPPVTRWRHRFRVMWLTNCTSTVGGAALRSDPHCFTSPTRYLRRRLSVVMRRGGRGRPRPRTAGAPRYRRQGVGSTLPLMAFSTP